MTTSNIANIAYGPDRYKPKRLDYVCHIDGTCEGETIGDLKIRLEVAYPDCIKHHTPRGRSKVVDMLSDFKTNFIEFCKKERAVHSFWLCVDHSKKNISIYTIIDDFDYSLERKIFSGPFSDLPPIYDGYFIDLQVANLGNRDISEIVPDYCKLGYSRG